MAMLLNYNSSLTAISSTNTLSPDAMSHLTGKDPNTGKDGGQKEKRAAERWLDSITNSMDMT